MFYHFCFALLFVSACNGQFLQNSPATTDPGLRLPNNNPAPITVSNDSSFGRGLIDNGGLLPDPNINDLNDSGLGLGNDESTPNPNERPLTHDPIDEGHIIPHNDSGVLPYRDEVCQRRFGFYGIESKCDAYVECRNYRAAERICPDGLHFNPNSKWTEYPCGYPMDVPCLGRGSVQPARPTAECPHQFGFYPVSDASMTEDERCSHYIMCAEGNAVVMDCPFGLAFNTATNRCDWPEEVPSCRNFLGFQCPDAPLRDGAPADDIVINYPYNEGECYYFWSCHSGRARVLSCDYGLAFDPSLGRCVDEYQVHCDHNMDEREPISEP